MNNLLIILMIAESNYIPLLPYYIQLYASSILEGNEKENLILQKYAYFFPFNQPAQRDIIIVIMSRRQFPTDLRWILIYLNFFPHHCMPYRFYGRLVCNQYSASVFTTLSGKRVDFQSVVVNQELNEA